MSIPSTTAMPTLIGGHEEEPRLCFWGECCDRSHEMDYLESTLHTRKRSLYPVLLILVATFSLFLAPDILANADNPRLAQILVIRISVILWLVLLFPLLSQVQTPKSFSLLLGLSQGIVGATFLYLSSLYRIPDFSLQVLTFALLILSFYTLPSSLRPTSMVSILLWFLFLWLASGRFPDATMREWLVAVLFPLLFLMVAFSFRLRIEREQRKMYFLQKQLRRLSEMDPLTGAANRYRFNRELDLRFQEVRQNERPLSVVLMDVDRFKEVNDRYGHQTGDLILVGLCGVFQRHLRQHDLLVRWGGEEFALLLPDTTETRAAAIAELIRASVEKTVFTPGDIHTDPAIDLGHSRHAKIGTRNGAHKDSRPNVEKIAITGSFGVAQATRQDSEISLLARADNRMYKAKALGRNRVVSGNRTENAGMPVSGF